MTTKINMCNKEKQIIFKELKIRGIKLDNKSDMNHLLQNHIKTTARLSKELKNILEDKDLSILNKQKQLEKLSFTNQEFTSIIQYSIPSKFSKKIKEWDEYLLDTKHLKSKDLSPYFLFNLNKAIGIREFQRRSNKTKPIVRTISLLKMTLKIYKYMKFSPSLFIIYTVISFIRKDFNPEDIKDRINEEKGAPDKIYFLNKEISEKAETEGAVTLNLRRTALSEELAKE